MRHKRPKVINQQNPPRPKETRVDDKGNDSRIVYTKSGTSTTGFAKFPSENAAKAFEQQMYINAKNLGGKIICNTMIKR